MSTKKAIPMTVAEYLALQIEASPKAQFEIAEDCGFEKPNVITMIKQGKTKLPLAKIGLMARSLNIDPVYLFKMVMAEYMPETWEAIEDFMGASGTLTANEQAVVQSMRDAGLGGTKLSADQRRDLTKWLKANIPH